MTPYRVTFESPLELSAQGEFVRLGPKPHPPALPPGDAPSLALPGVQRPGPAPA